MTHQLLRFGKRTRGAVYTIHHVLFGIVYSHESQAARRIEIRNAVVDKYALLRTPAGLLQKLPAFFCVGLSNSHVTAHDPCFETTGQSMPGAQPERPFRNVVREASHGNPRLFHCIQEGKQSGRDAMQADIACFRRGQVPPHAEHPPEFPRRQASEATFSVSLNDVLVSERANGINSSATSS